VRFFTFGGGPCCGVTNQHFGHLALSVLKISLIYFRQMEDDVLTDSAAKDKLDLLLLKTPTKRPRLLVAEETDSSACDSSPTTEADAECDSASASSPGGSSSTSALSPPPLLSPTSKALNEAKDSSRDLAPELVAAGWRKCYSAREQCHYFFNKVTRQTTWAAPELAGGDRSNGRKRHSVDCSAPPSSARKFIDRCVVELYSRSLDSTEAAQVFQLRLGPVNCNKRANA
jgi:hypothetical protein